MQATEQTMISSWNIFWKAKKFILVTVFVLTLLSIVVSLLLPKWYKATAVVLPPSGSENNLGAMSLLSDFGFGGMFGGDENIFRYVAILKSRTLMEIVAKKFDLQTKYELTNMELVIKKFSKNLNVDVGEENQVAITLFDRDQNIVAEMTNFVVACMDSMNIELSVSNARNQRMFLEKRVNEVLDSLVSIGSELTHFLEAEGILSLEDQLRVGVERAAYLQADIVSKEVELAVAIKDLGMTNPMTRKIQFELNTLREKYNNFIQGKDDSKLMPDFKKVPGLLFQLEEMQRRIDYYSTVLKYLGPQYEQQKFEEAKNIPTLQILDRAVRPERKAKPKRSIVVIAAFLASWMIALYAAYWREKIKVGPFLN